MTNNITEPPRIARLPKDKRGYPIPFNVLRGKDSLPIFAVNDDTKSWRCLREELCPICGERLGSWRWMAGGPLSAFDPHGFYYDLPMHKDCVEYAMQVCPYLAVPRYLGGRLESLSLQNKPENIKLIDVTMLPDRPELFVALGAKSFEGRDRFPMTPLLKPLPPLCGWMFWRHGKQLTDAEALPHLQTALGVGWQLPLEKLG